MGDVIIIYMAKVLDALWNAQTAILTAQTAQIAAEKTRLTYFSEAAAVCDAMTAENDALAAVTNDEAYYTIRRESLTVHARLLNTLLLTQQQQGLLDLQFNGVEIDLDVVKCLLVGKNLLISEP